MALFQQKYHEVPTEYLFVGFILFLKLWWLCMTVGMENKSAFEMCYFNVFCIMPVMLNVFYIA